MIVVLVGVGGAVGAVARYAIDHTARHRFDDERPLGVLAVNVAGSLALGLVFGWLLDDRIGPDTYRVVSAGLLGGFTTFSTVVVDAVLMAEPRARDGTVYAAASLVGGTTAAALGMWLGGAL